MTSCIQVTGKVLTHIHKDRVTQKDEEDVIVGDRVDWCIRTREETCGVNVYTHTERERVNTHRVRMSAVVKWRGVQLECN